MTEQEKAEQQKFEEFYSEEYYPEYYEEEKRESCPDGFTDDEDCDPEIRRGIEYCEFLCPFHRLHDKVAIVLRNETKEEKP